MKLSIHRESLDSITQPFYHIYFLIKRKINKYIIINCLLFFLKKKFIMIAAVNLYWKEKQLLKNFY